MDEPTPWTPWQTRIAASRKRRDDRIATWQENVARRLGATSATTATDARASSATAVNQDWPLTKAKIAQLYSQTPQVRLSPKSKAFAPAVPVFAKAINDTLDASSVGTAVEEVLADVINASGIGAVIVSCERTVETKIDPVTQMPVPMPADSAYPIERISPADLLVPSDFTGSNYDKARWLGYDGRMTWEQAVRTLQLTEDQKEDVLGGDDRTGSTKSLSTDGDQFRDSEVVQFTELFYWRHFYHPEETRFKALQRLVFVRGIDEPVVNEPYKGQVITETGIIGVTRNPIRACTLTYISDEGLPPSDSTIGRFQVNELEASRDAMVQQRKHSIPVRWFDPNRVSPNTRTLLDKGDYQGFLPIPGGDRAIGEVARANYPQEKFEFDKIIKSDLTEMWQVGTNQAGAFASGERSASEAKIIQQNFQTRVGQEREKVTKFFLGIAEVVAGHLALYGDIDLVSQIDAQRMETWDRRSIANQFVYTVRADSTVLLDAQQRIKQLTEALNLTAQSGYINPKPVIEEIWELSGMDPAKVVVDPQPKPPEPVKVSVSNAADLINPVMLALLMRTGQAPTPEDLAAAVKAINNAMQGIVPAVPPEAPDGRPPRDAETPGMANADWQAQPRVEKRAQDATGAPN
jgi:hypothetical protein